MSSFCPAFLRQPSLLSSECKPPHRGGQRGSLLSTWLCSGSLACGWSPPHAESGSSRGQGRAHTQILSAPRLSSPFPHMPAAVVDAVLILVLLASFFVPFTSPSGPDWASPRQKLQQAENSPKCRLPLPTCPRLFSRAFCILPSLSLSFGRGAGLM